MPTTPTRMWIVMRSDYCSKRVVQILAVTVIQSRSSAAKASIHSSAKSSKSLAFNPPLFHHTRWPILSRRMSSMSSSIQEEHQVTMTSQTKNRVALLQFHVTEDKSRNISTARQYITKARDAGARLCVLPECWNSPYATAAFGEYSESLPSVGDDMTSEEWGPSTAMLMEMAKSTGMYILGGSVPEISGGKLYNTCLVVNPAGKIVGKHRKVHLFDVDVPGGIRFMESDTLSAGDGATYFDMDDDEENGLGRIGVGIW